MTKSLIPKTPALNNLASCTCNVMRTLRRLKSELLGASFEFSDATLQELNHLGVGFVSLTEALDLTTPAGRTMAGLLAIFAEFEREVLRERTRAGLAESRLKCGGGRFFPWKGRSPPRRTRCFRMRVIRTR